MTTPASPGTAPSSSSAVASGAAPSSPALAVVPATSAALPNLSARDEILSLLVEELLKDPAADAVLKAPVAAQPQILRALAGVIKSVTPDGSVIRTWARERWVEHFAPSSLAAVAEPEFDGATARDVTYWEFVRLGLPASTVDEEALSPGVQATQRAFRRLVKGGLRDSYACLVAILRANPVLVGGELEFSDMDECETINRAPVEEPDVGRIREALERNYFVPRRRGREVEVVGLEFGKSVIEDGLRHVASERRYHAVQEFLRSLPAWDGVQRLDRVASELLHAERQVAGGATEEQKKRIEDLNRLARVQVRKTFIAAVARALAPGCKAENVLVLKGPQGKKKSSFFAALVPTDRFSDTDIDIRNKDALLHLRKVWIYEWSELSVMRSAKDVQTVKGFLSSRVDTYRPPYGRRVVARPRHCIIVGTTNEDEFLADASGDRRFWVIVVDTENIDLEQTAAWRDQLWAEALVAYRAGEQWWLDDKDDQIRSDANAEHREVDPWFDAISEWLSPRPEPEPHQGAHQATPVDPKVLTAAQVMREALSLPSSHHDKQAEKRVGAILRRLGYTRAWRGRQRVWRLETA